MKTRKNKISLTIRRLSFKTSILFSKPNYNLPSFATQAKFVSPFVQATKKVYTPPSYINAPSATSAPQSDVPLIETFKEAKCKKEFQPLK